MNRKELMGAALAALVGLGMLGAVAPAAAKDTDPATITVYGESINGHTLKAVRIATYDNVVTDTTGQPKVTGFDLVTVSALKKDLAQWVVDRVNDKTTPGGTIETTANDTIDLLDPLVWVAQNWKTTGTDHWSNPNSANPDVRALANWLRQGVYQDKWSLVGNVNGEAPATVKGTSDTAVLNVLEGLHLVWDAGADEEAAPGTTSLPIIVGTAFKEGTLSGVGTINVKGELVTLDKDITTANAGEDSQITPESDTPEPEDVYTAATGQVLDFIIRTNVPYYLDVAGDGTFDENGDNKRVFTVTDTWSDGLGDPIAAPPYTTEADGNTLFVKVDGEPLDGTTHFTYSTTPGTNKFTLALTQAGITEANGKDLTIEYKAKVTAAAKLVNGNEFTRDTNEAYVTFTNDWNVDNNDATAEEESTAPDTVYVYTYPFDIVKRDLVSKDVIDAPTVFTVTGPFADEDGEVDSTASRDVSTANGLSRLTGLQGNALYTVVEKTPPAGYTAANTEVAKFTFYIEVDDAALVEGVDSKFGIPKFTYGAYDATFISDTHTLAPELGSSPWVNPTRLVGPGLAATGVDVFNAKSASDMPSTGGQILLWGGIAGALGLGAVTFAGLGLRKRKATA